MQSGNKPIEHMQCIIPGKVNNIIFMISLTSLFPSSESEEMGGIQPNSRHAGFFVRGETAQFLKWSWITKFLTKDNFLKTSAKVIYI